MNKHRKILKAVIALITIALTSCTGVTHSQRQETPKISGIDKNAEQIMITNYGYYLFNCIPLGSGSTENNSFELFSDKVNLNSAMQTFNNECERLGATQIANLQAEKNSTCFFSWCSIGTTLGIYWYKEIQVSGTINSTKENLETSNENR